MLATKGINGVLKVPPKEIKNISYAEFADKVKKGEISFEVRVKNKYKSLKMQHRFVFHSFVTLYTFIPLVVIPFFTYKYENLYLLLGVLISATASMTCSKGIIVLLLIYTTYCVHGWFHVGFYCFDLFTFYALCGWWGYMWASIAETVEEAYFSARILQDENLYNTYAEKNAITIY